MNTNTLGWISTYLSILSHQIKGNREIAGTSLRFTLRKEEIIRFMYIYSKFWSCQLLHVVQRCRGKIWKNLIEGFWKRHEDTYDEIYKVHIAICFKKRTRQ